MICMQGVQQEPRTPSPIRSRVISPNNQVHSQNTLKVSLLLDVVLNTTIIMHNARNVLAFKKRDNPFPN